MSTERILERVESWQELEEALPQIIPLMQKCVDHYPDFQVESVEDILQMVAEGKQLLWLEKDMEDTVTAIALTRLLLYPRARVFQVNCIAGEMSEAWASYISHFLEFGKALGATHYEMLGRPGWKKFLEPLGFKVIQHQFIRQV